MEKKPLEDEKVPSQAYTLFSFTTYSLHMADFSFFKTETFQKFEV